ncbi:putative Zinc finger protein [Tubulinosema ratisbonensis]|uniref:Putative Zinc finger protein n=1 Tax=Tubulinosema ratisbonensis TaxID=291195 RepID=A0A437AHA6_9MICR|nr:putative Zinc finger protein [Tubulinosema ratisbonensis]
MKSKEQKNIFDWTICTLEDNWETEKWKWSVKTSVRSQRGRTTYYYCKSKSVNECKAQLRVDFDVYNAVVCVAKKYQHNELCVEADLSSCQRVNSRYLKELIISIHNSGVRRPRDIFSIVKTSKKDINLSKRIIYNVLYSYKKKQNIYNQNFTSEDFATLCKKYNKPNEDNPKVFKYTLAPLRAFITSKKLLYYFSIVKNLHIDATYKINIYSFPVIILGFSDLNKRFICCGVVIAENENTDTYLWIFECIKEFLETHKLKFTVNNIIADNSEQISAAVRLFDPNIKRTNCWAHVYRLINRTINGCNDIIKNEFKKEILSLQCFSSQKLFNQGIKLLLLKYSQFTSTKQFIEEFNKKYVGKNSNWYEAFDIWSPSTNNSLERFNLRIKESYINWEKMNFNDFFDISLQIISDCGEETPRIDKILYTSKEALLLDFEFLEYSLSETEILYLIRKKNENNISLEIFIQKYTECFFTINDFLEYFSSVCFLTVRYPIINFMDIVCSCSYFAKNRKCSHIYNFLKNKNLLNLVDIALINVKAGRGRPKKIKKNAGLKKEAF